jgi:uncharacterized protein YndB with AHSA1/START domain
MGEKNSIVMTLLSEREIAITRVFDAPRSLVFEAYTSPEHLPHWLLGPPGWTMTVCEMDLRPGGAWHWAWRNSDGREMEMRGVYKEVQPPERVVSTESWGAEWPETLNTVTFTEEGGKTTLSIRILYASEETLDAAIKTGMKEGLNMSYDRLAEHLAAMVR